MIWDKVKIKKQDGGFVDAQAPVIISASRSTDIPAFYSDWFVNRLREGYVKWKNPFNGAFLYVSFAKARLVIFWSKNPRPILKHLSFFDDRKINYYFQYTLNDYDAEKLEPRVPNINFRIDTFIELSEKIGKKKVIWRFDPLILTDKFGVDELLRKVESIGDRLKNHTEKMVFSFVDIKQYRKVQYNLRRNSIKFQEFNERTMNEIAEGLQLLNQKWNFEIGTCAEKLPLEKYGIIHNKCIDDDLIINLFNSDRVLMDFLNVKISPPDLLNPTIHFEKQKYHKDKGQREFCGCITSKDIGEYNTCPHLCEYCYANTSQEIALKNWNICKENINNEMIKGD